MKQLDRAKLLRSIENRVILDLLDCNVGGASILVAQDGEIVYQELFGTSDLKETAISDGTLFRLASMTKPITAVATMILVERGLLSLEDTVDRFYPSFSSVSVRNEQGDMESTDKKITIRSILTHSSGIGSGAVWTEAAGKMTQEDIADVESFVEFLSKQPLSFVPETKQEYSGVGAFSVLTGIIQQITRQPYAEFLKKEIFDPCRMKDTTFEPTEEQWGRLIEMHDKVEDQNVRGKTYEGCVFERFPTRNYLGGAGLISSMEDYLNFARMLLNGGVFDGVRVLSEASAAEISRPQVFKRAEEAWGLGVRVITEEKKGSLPMGAYGWSGAYGCHFWIDPANRVIGIYMKNSRYDGGSGAITSRNFEKDVYSALIEN